MQRRSRCGCTTCDACNTYENTVRADEEDRDVLLTVDTGFIISMKMATLGLERSGFKSLNLAMKLFNGRNAVPVVTKGS